MTLPIPHTGRRRWHRRRSRGVSASSRIIPHRYADEGDRGRWFRRLVRRREEKQWVREAREESKHA
ncbi:hypothetical protein [Streptomyces sp. NPDC057748]|uniref:hypothetical protein n=1 Tax=unclassified Streptomyces TaxID=2593676 RepID=UPI00368EBF60